MSLVGKWVKFFAALCVAATIPAVLFLVCSKSEPTKSENNNQTQDIVKTVQLEPGKADSVVFSDQFKIAFPAGSVNANTAVQALEVNVDANVESYASTDLLSPAYILTPHGQVLQTPAQVEFDISQIQIPSGLTAEDLDIFTWDGEKFESQNAKVVGSKLVCELQHFSVIYVRMKAFGACNIYVPRGLKVYKQNGYLCFENVWGDLTFNWYKTLWNAIQSPENYKVNYQVSLYESPTFGLDKLVWAKQSCRIVWQDNGISNEPIWKPGYINMSWEFVSDPVVYDHFPKSVFWGWNKKNDVSSNHTYGDEYIINYNSTEKQIGEIIQLPRRSFDIEEPVDFVVKVFLSDDMRQFIELSNLDENKQYSITVKIDYSDWQFGASNSLSCSDFKLKDIADIDKPNQPPLTIISNPSNGASFTQGQNVTFTGSGSDPEDGTLSGSSLVWTSDRDGGVGTGTSFTKNNLSVGTHQIRLTATDSKGLAQSAGIVITITQLSLPIISATSSLAFSSVPIGSSNDVVLTIQNTGNAVLNVTEISSTDAQFTVISGGTNFNIQAGGSHDVTVRFTPSSVGNQSGILQIANNSAVNPKEINLSGTGAAASSPLISVPSSLSFGAVTIGNSNDQILHISNIGNVTLNVTGIISTDAHFTLITGGTNFSIQAGGSHDVTIRFTPDMEGSQSGVLRIVNNSSVNPKEVNLSGTGKSAFMPVISVPNSLNFGNVSIGNSNDQTFSISNTGNAVLNVSDIISTDTQFSIVSGSTNFNISPGGSHDMTIRFTPGTVGSQSGILRLVNNSAQNPTAIQLSGVCIQAQQPSINIEWVTVVGGLFLMGDLLNEGGGDKRPVHSVTLSSFEIGKYEVTNAQYAAFLNSYGSESVKSGDFAGQVMIYDNAWGIKKSGGVWVPAPGYDSFPVIYITWYGANEFCQFNNWRLPTEAEWEYAAKGGNQSHDYKYSGSDNINQVAWFWVDKTHEVGIKMANELGIFDMSGNVWEWCQDWYQDVYYQNSPSSNPQGPDHGVERIVRGGSWSDNQESACWTTTRNRNKPKEVFLNRGFRVSRTP